MEYLPYDVAHLDELIAQEEALIECREAKLYIAKSRLPSSNPTTKPDAWVSDGSATLSALDWILQLSPNAPSPPEWKDIEFARNLAQLSLRFQSLLYQFCFTSVAFGTSQRPDNALPDKRKHQTSYMFCGYFLTNQTVAMQIHVVFAEGQKGKPHVSKVQCRLVSQRPTADDWSWLEYEVHQVIHRESSESPTHYLALFIASVSGYLSFDSERRKRLDPRRTSATTSSCRCWRDLLVKHEKAETLLSLPIAPLTKSRGEEDGSSIPQTVPMLKVAWVWQWKTRKESLRIVSDESTVYSPLYFGRNDLLQLLAEFNDDCWIVVQYLLAYCTLCPSCGQKERHHATKASLAGVARSSSVAANRQLSFKQAALNDEYDFADDELGSSQSDNSVQDKASDDDSSEFDFTNDDSDYKVALSDQEVDSSVPSKRKRGVSAADDSSFGTAETPVGVAGQAKKERHSPFRLSPSGRRRSDYEVQRCLRIQRNENKLTQLGFDTVRITEKPKVKAQGKARPKSMSKQFKEFESSKTAGMPGKKRRKKGMLQQLKEFSASNDEDKASDDDSSEFDFFNDDSDYKVALSDQEVDSSVPSKRKRGVSAADDSSFGTAETPVGVARQAKKERHSPFRLSPSGRRRSDYEVQRCLRIQRNENKLTQLGFDTVRITEKPKVKAQGKARPKSMSKQFKEFESSKTAGMPGKKRRKKGMLQQLKEFSASNDEEVLLSPRFGLFGRSLVPFDSGERNGKNGLHSNNVFRDSTKVPTKATAQRKVWNGSSGLNGTNGGHSVHAVVNILGSPLSRRPRGRAPKGFHWNITLGAWEPLDDGK